MRQPIFTNFGDSLFTTHNVHFTHIQQQTQHSTDTRAINLLCLSNNCDCTRRERKVLLVQVCVLRNSPSCLFVAVVTTSSRPVTGKMVFRNQERKATKNEVVDMVNGNADLIEEASFWDRLLQETTSLGSPSASPTTTPSRNLTFDDPPLPSICPADVPEEQKIPENVLLNKKAEFEANNGTVLLVDSCPQGDECGPYDIVAQIQQVSERLNWEAYPTPDYELEGELTPPEPYVFRTALPVMAGLRCNANQMPYAGFIPSTYQDASVSQ